MSKITSRVWNTGIMFSGLAATIIGSRLGADTATLACTSGLLTYLASLAGNQTHGFLKDLWEKKPAPEAEEVFRNHHIRSLLTAAARAVIQDITARVREDTGKASQALIDAEHTLPEAFTQDLESADSPLATLSDFHAPDLLTRYATAQGQIPLLTLAIWQAFIARHLPLAEAESQALAEGFHTRFGEALWNLVKMDAATDQQGYAAVELLFHTRLLQAVQGTRKSIALIKKRVTRLIRSLDEKQTRHFQALLQGNAEMQAQLDAHAASFHRHLGAVHQTVKKVGKGVKGVRKGVKRVEDKLDLALSGRPSPEVLYKANLTARFAIHNAVGIPAVEDPKQKQGPDKIVDLFVQPTCTEQRVSPEEMQEDQKQGQTKAEALLPRLVKDRRVVLLADPGMGKSTLIQWLVTALAAPVPSRDITPFDKAIPLPIILREVVRDMPNELEKWDWQTLLETFFKHRHDEHKAAMAAPLAADDTTWSALLASPQAWFMLDGLDEIGDPAKRRALREAIWQGFEAHPQARFLITSRVVGYEQAEVHERIEILKDVAPQYLAFTSTKKKRREEDEPDHDSDKIASYQATPIAKQLSPNRVITNTIYLANLFYISPWDNSQQKTFSERWFTLRLGPLEGLIRAAEFMSAIQRHTSTGTIGRIPNLLLFMALLYRYPAELPNGRAMIYSGISKAYLKVIADSQRVEHRIGSNVPYTLGDKESILAILAVQMQRLKETEDYQHQANSIAFRYQIEEWLATDLSYNKNLKSDIDAFLRHIADCSGLFLEVGVKNDEQCYAFAHLSFQEYYASCWLKGIFRKIVNSKVDATDDLDSFENTNSFRTTHLEITEHEFAKLASKDLWREPLLFLAEQLNESSDDTNTLRKWLFPIKKKKALTKESQSLLASISINPQVNLPSDERKKIWRYLWNLYLSSTHQTSFNLAPTLLAASEYQTEVLNALMNSVVENKSFRLRLQGCTSLNRLYIQARLDTILELILTDCTNLTDISFVSNLRNLFWLSFDGCFELVDISPLKCLHNLRKISFKGCTNLNKLDDIGELFTLQGLDLRDCKKLQTIDSLSKLDRLEWLYLQGCTDLHKQEVNNLRTKLPRCSIYF